MSHDCPTCDRSFETRHGMRVHSSKVHDRRLGHWYECANCGDRFRDVDQPDRQYCSRACANTTRGDDLQERRECLFCGLSLVTWPSWDTKRHQACYFESRRSADRPADLRDLARELYVADDHTLEESWRLARGHGHDLTRTDFRDRLEAWGLFDRRPSALLESLDPDEIGEPTPDGDTDWREFYGRAD